MNNVIDEFLTPSQEDLFHRDMSKKKSRLLYVYLRVFLNVFIGVVAGRIFCK